MPGRPRTPREPARDEQREDRILMEIVVDAYNEHERAAGWYCYLENTLQFPFTATCTAKRENSPLRADDEVEVLYMAGDDECTDEIMVTIRWRREGLAVPLSQLKPATSTDPQTRQAVEDWHYWVAMGYQF